MSKSTSELPVRVATAAVLIALTLAILVWLRDAAIAAALGAVVLLGMWEWSAIAGIRTMQRRSGFVLLTALVMFVLYRYLPMPATQNGLWLVALLWWVIALMLVLRYQRTGTEPASVTWWRLLAGWAMMLPAWAAILALHRDLGALGVFALLIVIWVADSAAYLFGRQYGRRRLANRVSPGKSWEGVAAGLTAAVIVAFGTSEWVGFADEKRAYYSALCGAVVMVSVLGDLTESLFKRVAGRKDSGSLLPGHGGVLDRIDSLIAAAPLFFVGCRWLGGAA